MCHVSSVTCHLFFFSSYPLKKLYKGVELFGRGQCVANIRIFEYIWIFFDEYIHLFKYLWIFPRQIYSDIHLRLFPSHEYIRRFIRNVRFQRIHWFEVAQQNNICYSNKFRQYEISAIDIKINTPVLISYIIFTIHFYSFAKIFGQYFSFGYICTFIREYTTWTNIFGNSFVKM